MSVGLTGIVTTYDWTTPQGALDRRSIPVFNSSGLFPVDGWTVDAKIKDEPGGTVLHAWSLGDISAVGFYVTLTILPATSLGWAFVRGWYRVKVIHPSDATQVSRILQGKFTVSDD